MVPETREALGPEEVVKRADWRFSGSREARRVERVDGGWGDGVVVLLWVLFSAEGWVLSVEVVSVFGMGTW